MERQCPLCGLKFVETEPTPHRPFCSPRCKRMDLKNWLEGAYRLPRELTPEDLDQLSEEEREELFGLGAGQGGLSS